MDNSSLSGLQNVKANSRQPGGSHYANSSSEGMQHWDFVYKHNLDYFQGNSSKYLCRWRRKGGILDLQKALHYVEKAHELALSGPPLPVRDMGQPSDMLGSALVFGASSDMTAAEVLTLVDIMHGDWAQAAGRLELLTKECQATSDVIVTGDQKVYRG